MGKAKSKTTDGPQLSAAAQINELHHLTQAAAAELVGLHSKTLREKPNVPRLASGLYDGCELVRWLVEQSESAIEVPNLDDVQYERVLLAVDAIGSWDEAGMSTALQILERLAHEHGVAGLAVVGEVLLERARLDVERANRPKRVMSQSEREAKERREADDRAIEANLRLVHQCATCGRIRQGSKWVNRGVPDGYRSLESVCPSCF